MHLPAAFQFVENGVFLAIIAHGIIGISLIWDKVLLERPAMKSLANYVFWLGAISIFGLCLIPFGFHMPDWRWAGLGVAAGATQLAAAWFYYAALQSGEASEALAVMGGFAPLATALIAIPLLAKPLGNQSVAGFALMVAGGFVMFAAEKFNWRKVLPYVLLSSGMFGVTNDLQKIVFDRTGGFVTGYVFFTIGTFLGAMALLVRPLWRQQIFRQSQDAPAKSKFWYMVNRFISGVGSFLIFLAISKTSPAEVSAISGVRYAIIFAGAWLLTSVKPQWLREEFKGSVLIGKSVATAMVVAGLVLSAHGKAGGRTSGAGDEGLKVDWEISTVRFVAPARPMRISRSSRGCWASIRTAVRPLGYSNRRDLFQSCHRRDLHERKHGIERAEDSNGHRRRRGRQRHFRPVSLQVERAARFRGVQRSVHRRDWLLAFQAGHGPGPLTGLVFLPAGSRS